MSEIALDHQQVMGILPHRDPMLLIDEVVSLEPMQRIEAKLHIRPEWDIFRGHFPGSPIFPGVLSVECMAQASDVLIMTGEKYAGLTPLFASINNARFLRGILPGDVVTAPSWRRSTRPRPRWSVAPSFARRTVIWLPRRKSPLPCGKAGNDKI